MSDDNSTLAISLFSEVLTVDQLLRLQLAKVLPKGMELSHFSVLNHLAHINIERTPAQLAKSFHVTRGAMTNTLRRLEASGYVHIRPDWDDARKKRVAISLSGRMARDNAISAVAPFLNEAVSDLGKDHFKQILPILRGLRVKLEQ